MFDDSEPLYVASDEDEEAEDDPFSLVEGPDDSFEPGDASLDFWTETGFDDGYGITEEINEEESQGVRQDIEPVNSEVWTNILNHAFASTADFSQGLSFPWEHGTLSGIFGDTQPFTVSLNSIGDSSNLARLSTEPPVAPTTDNVCTELSTTAPAYLSAVKNMKDLEYMEDKKNRVSLAVGKWLDILSLNWHASTVGSQLSADMHADPTGDLAELTLRSVFGVKSPTTLLKRAASMKQYIEWFYVNIPAAKRGVPPILVDERDAWQYFFHLRDSRMQKNRGYTISSTFLETIRFCKFVFGLEGCDSIIGSKGMLGFASIERREKGPLIQAPPLEVEHLNRLHQVLMHGDNDIDRIGAGAFLCCIYARARWSDLRYIHHIKYDGFKRNATMDLYTCEHKTSSAGLRREQFFHW